MTAGYPRPSDIAFRRLFADSPTPQLVLAPDAPRFTIIEVNAAYLTATMRTREGLIGRALFDAFPDNPDDTVLRASLKRVLATRAPDAMLDLRYDIAGPDGTFEQRWWNPLNAPVIGEHGEVEAIIHQSTDVTLQRRTEAALRASEARLRFLGDLDEGMRGADDAPAAMQTAATLLAGRLGASRCAYADVDADGDRFVIRNDYAAPGIATSTGTYSLNLFGPRAAAEMRGGRTLVVGTSSASLRRARDARPSWRSASARSSAALW